MRPHPIIVDTDVLIDASRGHPLALDFLSRFAGYIHVSVMTTVELWAGVKGAKEEKFLRVLLGGVELIEVNNAIAMRACELGYQYRRSHGVGTVDTVIAATAEVEEMSLVTLNKKHFPMLKHVIVPYKK